MKIYNYFIIFLFLLALSVNVNGQAVLDTFGKVPNKQFVIQKFDGNIFIGKIIYQDPRVILLEVKKDAKIYIPKIDIEEIREINKKEIGDLRKYAPNDAFATKYIVSSSALPLQKKENFTDWNWYGPDAHFAVSNHFELSFMCSWALMPMIGDVKYNFELGEKIHFALGTTLGWGSWAYSDCSGVIPYASVTLGDRVNNLTVSGGHGLLTIYGESQEWSVFSLGGMAKIGRSSSVVFESFVLPSPQSGTSAVALFIPGIRLQTDSKSAFQLGIGTLFLDWDFIPAPIPFIQWFRKF